MAEIIKRRLSLYQFSPLPGDRKGNINLVEEQAKKAAGRGAELLLLPEMFTTGYLPPEKMGALAEPLDGESIKRLSSIAGRFKIALIGSFFEHDPSNGSCYNTCVFIDHKGTLLGAYRKMHLFAFEHNFIRPGDELCVVSYRGTRYGLMICFDLEFPEQARLLALLGAEVLLIPSANMEPFGPFHRTLATARAMENHLFALYCNQVGQTEDFDFVGESCLISPLGTLEAGLGSEEKLLMARCDLSLSAESKKAYDYLALRRFKLRDES